MKRLATGEIRTTVNDIDTYGRRLYRMLRQTYGFSRHEANLVMLGVGMVLEAREKTRDDG
jgi:hypothetical protein